MIRLSEETVRRTLALIERYGLHDDDAFLPVPIRQVAQDEGWVICYRSGMGQALAMAFVVGGVKLMYVNENLRAQTQRVGIAHEIGHVLCGHRLGFDTAMQDGYADLHGKQEIEAQLVASLLLIPQELRDAPLTDREVSQTCQVPVSLVQLMRLAAPLMLLGALGVA